LGLQQVALVLRIQDLMLDAGACERLYGRARVPEAQGDELGAALVDARHCPGAPVARRALILASAGVADIPDVILVMLSSVDATSDASDHCCSFRSAGVASCWALRRVCWVTRATNCWVAGRG